MCYPDGMGKIGVLVLVSALALTGCAGANASPGRAEVQPVTVSDDAKTKAFVTAVQKSGTDYATMPPADIAGMAPELCQHYDGGFTTEDLRESAGDKLAQAGEAARLTVCPAR